MLACLLLIRLNNITMQIKKIPKRQLKNNLLLVRVNDQQNTLIKKSAKVNQVTYSEVLRSAITSYFEINDNNEED